MMNIRRIFFILIFSTIIFLIYHICKSYSFSSIFSTIGPQRRDVILPAPLVNYDISSSKTNSINDDDDRIYILTWTRRFLAVWPDEEIRDCARISKARCFQTSSRAYLNRSSVVIFHARDLNLFSDIPSTKYRFQRYIFYNHECPLLTRVPLQGAVQTSFFDWTMTYRRDSTIYCPYAYFESKNHSTQYRLTQYPEYFDTINTNGERVALEKRPKLVAWFVSNCETQSKRERYVHELQKHIPVDIYGDCGKISCPKRERRKCMEILASTYKFYVGFENSVCIDYISEKFTNRLELNLVILVLRRADYDRLVPSFPDHLIDRIDQDSNSSTTLPDRWRKLRDKHRRTWWFFVAADDFDTPKDLADYLTYLNENPREYLKYFEWRKYWRIVVVGDRHCNCELCEKLYEERQRLRAMSEERRAVVALAEKSELDIHEWWNVRTCHPNFASELARRKSG